MLKFNHTAHKEMWNWLAENPEMDKDDWHGWGWNGGSFSSIMNLCFACEYLCASCSSCPLIWTKVKGVGRVCHSGGLYERWITGENAETRSSIARQIANLPVRKGVETE